jgi:hypothetical protein
VPRPSVETLEERKRALRRVRTDPADCEAHITHALLSEGLDIAALAAQACALDLSSALLQSGVCTLRRLPKVAFATIRQTCRAQAPALSAAQHCIVGSGTASDAWYMVTDEVRPGVKGSHLKFLAVTGCRCSST